MGLKYYATSKTDPNVVYELNKEKLTCTCKGFRLGKKRPCKHLIDAFNLEESEPKEPSYQFTPKEIEESEALMSPTKKMIQQYATQAKENAPPQDKQPQLFTIGHSNNTIDNFLSLLMAQNIRILVDVRSKPYSRFYPHFSKNNLGNLLIKNNIQYLNGGQILGGLNEIKVSDAIFVNKLEKIIELSQTNKVVMMCSEADPAACHRAYKLSAWLIRQNYEVNHILKTGELLNAQTFEQEQKDDWVNPGFRTT